MFYSYFYSQAGMRPAYGTSITFSGAQSTVQAVQQALQMQQQMQQQNAQQAQSKPQQSSGQEDVTQKLQKLADLKNQGILSEGEFQKMNMELLTKL